MFKNIIDWLAVGNYRLVFVNIMVAIFCLSWFGNNYLFGAIIGLMIFAINCYIAYFVININLFNNLKNIDIATIIYRGLLFIVPLFIAMIITIFALYLICISDIKYSLNYIGGSFICFFEVVVLATIASKIEDSNGNIVKFLIA